MRTVLMLMIAAGCAGTGYRDVTEVRPLPQQRFLIHISGDPDAPTILDYTNRAAAELCPQGYIIEQRQDDETVVVKCTTPKRE